MNNFWPSKVNSMDYQNNTYLHGVYAHGVDEFMFT